MIKWKSEGKGRQSGNCGLKKTASALGKRGNKGSAESFLLEIIGKRGRGYKGLGGEKYTD